MELISQCQAGIYDSTSDSELEDYALPMEAVDLAASEKSIVPKKKRSGDRLPTRKPDPNVYNRNALLARENRKRKKAHVETLEKCLEECKRVNIKLLNALKSQRKVARRLEREKLYYKNLVANRTEIVSLVSALNGCINAPQRCSRLSQTSPAQDSMCSYSGSSSYEADYPAFTYDFSDNGSVAAEQNSISSFDFNDSYFLDNFLTEFERPAPIEDTWNELLHDKNFGLSEDIVENDTNNDKVNVQLEHSYVASKRPDGPDVPQIEPTGICLHINGGKVSLEFCPTCHWSYQEPPKQLLQGDLIESL